MLLFTMEKILAKFHPDWGYLCTTTNYARQIPLELLHKEDEGIFKSNGEKKPAFQKQKLPKYETQVFPFRFYYH